MSRVLKFRAWDKEKNRWAREWDRELEDQEDQIYEKEYSEDAYWLDGDVDSDLGLVNGRLGLDRYIWEQYTGLSDKNGKEIYEGDLIKVSDAPALKDKTLIVKFGEHYIGEYACNKIFGWLVRVINGDWASSLSDVVDGCEVVGNIHQNPELVGEEK